MSIGQVPKWRKLVCVRRDSGGDLVFLDSVNEVDSFDDITEEFVAHQSMPSFLGALAQLEDHGQHGLARQAASGPGGP